MCPSERHDNFYINSKVIDKIMFHARCPPYLYFLISYFYLMILTHHTYTGSSRRDQSCVSGVISSLIRGGGDVNCRTLTLNVTPLTLLLQRAASSSKSTSPRDKGKGKENGRGDRGRVRNERYSPGSKGTTLDSSAAFLDHTQGALLSSDTDDKTTLYGNQHPDVVKCSPKGSGRSQGDIDSVSIEDSQRNEDWEGRGRRGGQGQGGGGGGRRMEGTGRGAEDGWVDESYMTWTNTAMQLLKAGER